MGVGGCVGEYISPPSPKHLGQNSGCATIKGIIGLKKMSLVDLDGHLYPGIGLYSRTFFFLFKMS